MNSLPPGFSQGIIQSERAKIRLLLSLLGLIGIPVIGFLVAPGTFGRSVAPELHAPFRAAAPLILGILGAAAVFELFSLRQLGILERDGRKPAAGFHLLQSALEVSWVTGLLWLSAHTIGAVQTFSGPVVMMYFPAIALSALNLDLRLSLWSGLVAASGFVAVVAFYLPPPDSVEGLPMLTSRHQYAIRAILLLLAGGASAFVAFRLRSQLAASLRNARERDMAVAIFGQHVSPQVAGRLLSQPNQSFGEERDVCIMFLDIRDFSVLASKKSAGEVMEFLNTLFDGLIACVNAHKGIVNKFLGDGFMAVFGAPENDSELCANAVRCACDLLDEVERMNRSGAIPPTRIGIGLHLGPAVTGIVGSEARKEYTVIGDTVNLAARIEQATKALSCELLISEAVRRALPPHVEGFVDVGQIELKGQSKPAHLFKLSRIAGGPKQSVAP